MSESTQQLIADLQTRGIRLLADGGRLILDAPKGALEPQELERIRANKPGLLAHLHAEQEAADIGRVARADGWKPLPPALHPAYSLLTTCRRYGVALRIDPENGDLVVGKAGAKADEPTQPWVVLVRELEAHVEAVATLVEAGWTLRAEFPKEAAA